MPTEIIFMVEEDPEGGYTAHALGYSIVTEGDDMPELRRNVRDAVHLHFTDEERPAVIRLHLVKDEVISA
ncbi:MAG: 2-oxoisovalerate dehydrogenase [Chloroflexi bacterium]|nr:2-oxoisovalerate dehydrogenase [Chloroflexota bacterium]